MTHVLKTQSLKSNENFFREGTLESSPLQTLESLSLIQTGLEERFVCLLSLNSPLRRNKSLIWHNTLE